MDPLLDSLLLVIDDLLNGSLDCCISHCLSSELCFSVDGPVLSFGLAAVCFVFPLFSYSSFDSSEESDEELLDVAIFVFYLFTRRFFGYIFSPEAALSCCVAYPAFAIYTLYLAPNVRLLAVLKNA